MTPLVQNTILERFFDFWMAGAPDQEEQRRRVMFMERNIMLPVKGFICVILLYYLFFSNWVFDLNLSTGAAIQPPPREGVLEKVRVFFLIYLMLNIAAGFILAGMEQFRFNLISTIVILICLLDGLFLAAMSLIAGGFDTLLYWVYLGMIVRNAVSNPIGSRQILLNLCVSLFYLSSGLWEVFITEKEFQMLREMAGDPQNFEILESSPEPFLLRLFLLWLMTVCCYGVQVLIDKERLTRAELSEFAMRQQQLQATGRLAAEIAHQLKNPLAIMNNAAFNLQKTSKEGKRITQQIAIIREEIQRSDQIITELMGYAKLTEGKVEKVDVHEELERAILLVFPQAANYAVEVHRDYAVVLPPLLVQRMHFSEIISNLLQNAREAMGGEGHIWMKTEYGENYTVKIHIRDSGPGVPPEKLSHIFEPYFTTKEKGTGLGLAIVKHNTEIYGGQVNVESELGKGTHFSLVFPGRTIMKIRK